MFRCKVCTKASPYGGLDTTMTYATINIIMTPKNHRYYIHNFLTTLLTKIKIEKIAVIAAPHFTSIPNIAFNPRPAPAILPILNANPPNAIKTEITVPSPGTILLDTSCPLKPVTTRTSRY